MAKAALVVMAAGMGSRFKGGIKQLAPVGPNDEIIMEYSIYDAIEAGFDKIVFVIKKEHRQLMEDIVGKRIRGKAEVVYVYQGQGDIPEPCRKKYQERVKPWGTGHAILCCRDVVQEPFLVINADDFYGKEAYAAAYQFLIRDSEPDRQLLGMVGFVLGNTLSEHGGVTRGICKTDEKHKLTEIVETFHIERVEGRIVSQDAKETKILDGESLVSMNMWCFREQIFPILEMEFQNFLQNLDEEWMTEEFLLPDFVWKLIREGRAEVEVLQSNDRWFGVTYMEDRALVSECIRKLIKEGKYPELVF